MCGPSLAVFLLWPLGAGVQGSGFVEGCYYRHPSICLLSIQAHYLPYACSVEFCLLCCQPCLNLCRPGLHRLWASKYRPVIHSSPLSPICLQCEILPALLPAEALPGNGLGATIVGSRKHQEKFCLGSRSHSQNNITVNCHATYNSAQWALTASKRPQVGNQESKCRPSSGLEYIPSVRILQGSEHSTA